MVGDAGGGVRHNDSYVPQSTRRQGAPFRHSSFPVGTNTYRYKMDHNGSKWYKHQVSE